MPRFYFHSENGRSFPDADGTELPSLEAARHEAVVMLGEVISQDPSHFWATGEWRLIVKDDTDLCLFMLVVTSIDGAAGPPRAQR